MRKIFSTGMLLCLFVITAHAQDKSDAGNAAPAAKDTLAPYQKYPTLPAFNILMMDSITIFNTYNIPEGKPIALFFFSPDCKHCRQTTKRLIEGMDSLKEIQFYMVTAVHSMTELHKFYDDYHLGDYKNIQLAGRDYEFFFGSYYLTRYVPDIALYDEHKKLVKLIQGETNVKAIYDALYSRSISK